jgi:Holliday junction resolvasome RuvABC ATP-dependent DNA helicase subunit
MSRVLEARLAAREAANRLAAPTATAAPAPVPPADRTRNPLRPAFLGEMIGQEQARQMLLRVIAASAAIPKPLDHVLLVGSSGAGKTTFANAIANELCVDCFQVEAPISHDTLLALRGTMRDGDILFLDEVHQQAVQERRGRQASTQPEVLFGVMEDQTIATSDGVLPFPHITVIGATTDEGMLPDPFVNRFPLRPYLAPYAVGELCAIAQLNAQALGVSITPDAERMFATASRGVPRQINNYVKNGHLLAGGGVIDAVVADEVLHTLNRVTEDGLTADMQKTLTFLLTRCKRVVGGDVRYQASVSTIATAIGKARDTKAVVLRVEPYLIEQGYLQVGHGGRTLTAAGAKRAKELL